MSERVRFIYSYTSMSSAILLDGGMHCKLCLSPRWQEWEFCEACQMQVCMHASCARLAADARSTFHCHHCLEELHGP